MTNSNSQPPSSAPKRKLSWHDPGVRSVIYQVLAIAVVGGLIWFLVHNTMHNLSVRNIATGFGFLHREAGFAIGETLISYTPQDTYGRAILVGLLNTLRVAVIGIVLATILGTIIGIARLSKNWLIAKLASIYVEVMRNIPPCCCSCSFGTRSSQTTCLGHGRLPIRCPASLFPTGASRCRPWRAMALTGFLAASR